MTAGGADLAIVKAHPADVAQLVEHLVANEKVAGSSPVVRSRLVELCARRPVWSPGTRLSDHHAGIVSQPGGVAEWLRQGPAKPRTWVRFPPPPRGGLGELRRDLRAEFTPPET